MWWVQGKAYLPSKQRALSSKPRMRLACYDCLSPRDSFRIRCFCLQQLYLDSQRTRGSSGPPPASLTKLATTALLQFTVLASRRAILEKCCRIFIRARSFMHMFDTAPEPDPHRWSFQRRPSSGEHPLASRRFFQWGGRRWRGGPGADESCVAGASGLGACEDSFGAAEDCVQQVNGVLRQYNAGGLSFVTRLLEVTETCCAVAVCGAAINSAFQRKCLGCRPRPFYDDCLTLSTKTVSVSEGERCENGLADDAKPCGSGIKLPPPLRPEFHVMCQPATRRTRAVLPNSGIVLAPVPSTSQVRLRRQ